MTDPFEELKRLEARVVKAEQRIPELESEVKKVSQSYAQAMDRNEELVTKLKRFEALETALNELFPSHLHVAGGPSVSSGASGTIGSRDLEVKDPSQIIEVADPQQPLRVSTTELRGQIAKLIVEGRIDSTLVNAKGVRGRLVAEFGSAGEAWDIDTVLKELKALAAPPFRLFSFSPKNYMFRLRTGSEKRVKE